MILEKILHAYLKSTGKGYLVPFLNGLSHLGRPSTVAFPMELMEQGMAIVLSGLNNTMAIQSNLDWVWPLWVERQVDPGGEEFIPTAINLIKTNLTCRNWTSVGLEDSPREGMVDPVGMLTMDPYGWSVFPFLRMDGRGFFPPRLIPRRQVLQSLLEGSLPCIVTRYEVDPSLLWQSEIRALSIDGDEFLGFSHRLSNRSPAHISLRFGLAIRPYNPLTMGHINSIRYQERLWRMNGRPGLLLLDEPDRVVISDRHHGDPLLRDVLIAGRKSLKSKSGIACGQAEFDLELDPGETRVIDSLGFLGGGPGTPAARLLAIPRAAYHRACARQTSRWRDSQAEGMRVRLPEAALDEAFQAVRNHIHVFDDGDHFSPGTFLYHAHWFRDSAFIALAFENMGWGARVEPKLRDYPRQQTRDGFFKSQRGEWDSNGQAMWTLVNHVRRGGDPDLLELFHPALIKGARWIDRMRSGTRGAPSPHYGLMPAGFSAEHFGPNDHYYWDNLWSIAGLEAARWAAEKLGRTGEAAWLADMLEDYRGDLFSSMDWAWKKCGGKALPCSPYRSLDSAAIGNLVGISPLYVLDPDIPWLKGTLDYLMDNNLREGLFFQRIVHTGLNPYLSVQLARALMARGDARWFPILEALVRRASPTYTWPEAMHPRMFGGCMGDGDHGWSAAEFLNLIRDMLVSERGGVLRLAQAVPAHWYRPGMHLEAQGATTPHGTVSFTLRQGPEAAVLTWSVVRKPHQDPAPILYSLPISSGLAPAAEGSRVTHSSPMAGAVPETGAGSRARWGIEGGCYRVSLPGDSGTLTFPTAPPPESFPEDRNQPRKQHA